MASTVWRGYVTFGLISIPVRLFRAARAERVSLRRLYKSGPVTKSHLDTAISEPDEPDEVGEEPAPVRVGRGGVEAKRAVLEPPPAPILNSTRECGPNPAPAAVFEPVRQASLRGNTNEVVPERAVVKGFEYEENRFVALDREELKSIAPKTATEMQIEEFVSLPEVDPVYFETSYYVVPEEAGKKAYALLYRALQTTKLVAVAQFAMHSREHVVLLRPGKSGIIAHTMFFSSEVRAEEEYRAETEAVTSKELNLAETLIHSLAAPFEPQKYRDSYREKLEALIAKKVAGEPVPREELPQKTAAVVDITEALQRSLAVLKAPRKTIPVSGAPREESADSLADSQRGSAPFARKKPPASDAGKAPPTSAPRGKTKRAARS